MASANSQASNTTTTTLYNYPYLGGRTYVREVLPNNAIVFLEFADGMVINSSNEENSTLFISAGEKFALLGIELLDGDAFDTFGARLRVVSGSVVAAREARYPPELLNSSTAGDLCVAGSNAEVDAESVDAPLYLPEGARTEDARDSPFLQLLPGAPFAFRNGGTYRVCYSYFGKFDANSSDDLYIVETRLQVLGITSPCRGSGCLSDHTFPCYALLGEHAGARACGVPLDGVIGMPGRVTWSPAFSGSYGGDGFPLPIHPGVCGDSPQLKIFVDPVVDHAVKPVTCMENCTLLDESSTEEVPKPMLANTMPLQSLHAILPQVMPFHSAKAVTTLAVCYCTSLRGCEQYDKYVQQFGIVYLFVATVTLPNEPMCTSSMSGVLSPLPFVICVHCPPGACSFRTSGSRVRLLPRMPGAAEQEVASWQPGHTCRAMSNSKYLHPSGRAAADIDGGPRADFKQFRPSGMLGFSLASWTVFEDPGSDLEICVCLRNCESESAWFKAGQLDVVAPQLMSSSTVVARAGTTPPRAVRLFGHLSLYRPWMPYGDPLVLGLEPRGAVRVVLYDLSLDAGLYSACARSAPADVSGLTFANASHYLSSEQTGRLVFNGGVSGLGLQVRVAGTLAVCYCPTPTKDAMGCSESPWVPIGALSVAGPRPNQYWVLPTYTTVRLSYEGNDLLGSDVLRFVNDSTTCESGKTYNFRENEASDISTNNLCPPGREYMSHELCDLAVSGAEFSTSILSHATVGCDDQNTNCKPNVFIEAVGVTGGNTDIRLTGPTTSPGGLGDFGLADDDVIVMGKGVDCGDHCTRDMLERVRGFRSFAGLQRYMALNDGSGAAAKDHVGGSDARLAGVPQWVAGEHLLGLRFSSETQWLSQELSDPLDASKPWSLLLWTQMENSGWHTLCGLANTNGVLEAGEMEVGVAGEPWPAGGVYLQQEGSVLGNLTTENATLLPGWNHVAVVYTGSFDGSLLFYVNGDLRYQRDDVRLSPTALPLTCGGGIDTMRDRAAGWLDLDEIRWYNIALSEQEVVLIMTDPLPTADNSVPAGSPIGNRIRKGADIKSFRLPGISWSPEPSFKVDTSSRTGGGGHWRRTNRAITRAEIITPNQQFVKVCWGRQGQFTQAGTIKFVNPELLRNVGIYFTSQEWSTPSPFVLAFTTNDATSRSGRRYAGAEGPMTLTLTVLHRETFDIASSKTDGYELPFDSEYENELHEASQTTCGKLFLEMWSDDPYGGFPLPKGCYFRGLPGRKMREIVLVFEPRNGLRGGQKYQLVMHGIADPMFEVSDELILINSGDDLNSMKYSGLEIGHAYGNQGFKSRPGKNDPQFRFETGFEVVNGDDRQLLELGDRSILSFRLRAPDYSTGAIKRSCLMQLWFWPLTQWILPTKCMDDSNRWALGRETSIRLKCHTYRGNYRRCGVIQSCIGSRVIPGEPQVNTIRLTMPAEMNDLFGTIVYQLDVMLPTTNRPAGGVMPTKIAAQLSRPNGQKPGYIVSHGPYLFKMPDTGFVLGRLLTDGANDVPFRGQPTYMIYLLVMLPVDLRGEDNTRVQPLYRPGSTMKITAPEGFQCLGITEAPPTGLGQKLITPDGFAMSGLSTVVQAAPTGFGTPDLRGWAVGVPDARSCLYTVLDLALIPAFSSMVLGVRVLPNADSLPITDPRNLWQVSVRTPGRSNQTLVDFSAGFYRTGPAGVPVLGTITDALVQPSNQTVSPPGEVWKTKRKRLEDSGDGATYQFLNVFFRTEQAVAVGGIVEVEAPEAFNFGPTCEAEDLDELYYVRGPPRRTYRLPPIVSCTGFVQLACLPPCLSSPLTTGERPYNVARIKVGGPMEAYQRYGFRVQVANPTLQNMSRYPDGYWTLRTRDGTGPAVDSTKKPVPGYATLRASTAAWQLAAYALDGFTTMAEAREAEAKKSSSPGVAVVELSTSLPYHITRQQALATVTIKVSKDFTGALQLAPPEGYSWKVSISDFGVNVSDFNMSEWNSSMEFASELDPTTLQGNTLVYLPAVFYGLVEYTFTAKLSVPKFSPVTSVPAFFINFVDLDETNGQGISAVVPTKPVRVLSDAIVRSTNRLPKNKTDLLFQVRLTTPVEFPGGLQIYLPLGGYIVDNPCEVRPWPGRPDWGRGTFMKYVKCTTWSNPGGPFVMLLPSAQRPLPVGLLRFRVNATNPMYDAPGPCKSNLKEPRVPCWTFSSNSRCSPMGCTGHVLDVNQTFVGVSVAPLMGKAGLLGFRPPGRDDRPSQKNLLVFYFRIAHSSVDEGGSSLPAGYLDLVGPEGFVFETLCHSGIETRRDVIFGKHEIAERDWNIDEWERDAIVTGCEGIGAMAIIRVAKGLQSHKTYAFRMPLHNPVELPEENYWTIAFQKRFSRPFASFLLWTFYDTSLVPLSPHAGPTCYGDGTCIGAGLGIAVPVNIRFRPYQLVTTGGELHVTMPQDFAFSPITPWPTNGQIVKTDQPTRCIVRRFDDANFSNTPFAWQKKDRECVIVSKGSPLDSSGTGDWRTMKITLLFKPSAVDPSPPSSFHPDHGYEISLFFDPPSGYRPPIKWNLETYSPNGDLLDVGFAPGYEVKPVLRQFEHSNAGINMLKNVLAPIVTTGLAPLPDFIFDIRLPDNAWPGDKIIITAPPGFQMQLGSDGPCIETYFLGPKVAETPPNRTAPVECSDATLIVYMREIKSAIQPGQQIRIRMMVSNPKAPPSPDFNYWLVEQRSAVGGLVSAAMAESWLVIPVLVDPFLNLTGSLRAGGKVTDLTLGFRTVQAAFELILEAVEPHTFYFQDVIGYADVGGRASYPQVMRAEENLVKLGTKMMASDRVTVEMLRIRIPSTPGRSRWRLRTFRLPEDYGLPSVLCDEVFFEGFYVPGSIETVAITAQGGAALLGKNRAELTFRIESTTPFFAGDELHLGAEGAGAEGFELLPPLGDLTTVDGEFLGSVVNETPGCRYPTVRPEDKCKQCADTFKENGGCEVMSAGGDVSDMLPTGCEDCEAAALHHCEAKGKAIQLGESVVRSLKIRLQNATTANQQLLLRVPLITPPDRGILALEKWRFEVFRPEVPTRPCDLDAGEVIATNDALPLDLPVVTPLPTEPAPNATLVPPITVVPVMFEFDTLDTKAAAIAVTAPAGYTYPQNCLGSDTTAPVLCTAFHVAGSITGSNRAYVVCKTGGTECVRGQKTYLLVKTPRATPPADQNRWFVEAMGPPLKGSNLPVGERLGRGTLEGFEIVDMVAGAIYGPLAGVHVELAIYFTSRVHLEEGGQVHVLAARALQRFGCGNYRVGFLKPLSLGTARSCEDGGLDAPEPFVNLKLNESLPPGDYVFTVPAQNPLRMPQASENLFEVKLRDAQGNNKDVALTLPGEPLVYGIRMMAGPLWWIPTVPWAVTFAVSVPLEILDDATAPFAAMLITLPLGPAMEHQVASSADLTVTSGQGSTLPLRSIVIPDSNSILLLLHSESLLRAGLYVVSFRARLPKVKPQLDIWRVALCGSLPSGAEVSQAEACSLSGVRSSGRGSTVRFVFAMAGFDASKEPDTGELLPGSSHVALVSGSPGGQGAAGVWRFLKGLLWALLVISAETAAA